MKIINSITIDIQSGAIIAEDSFEYNGQLAECKGGGSSITNTQDPAYNARMAAIAEQQQAIANEYYAFWQTSGEKELEQLQAQSNISLLPAQTALAASTLSAQSAMIQPELQANIAQLGLQQAQAESATRLTPLQEQFQTGTLLGATSLLPAQTALAQQKLGVTSQLLTEAQNANIPEKVAQAKAGVAQQYGLARGGLEREAGRVGLSTTQLAPSLSQSYLEEAKASVAAATQAQRQAEQDRFARLATLATSSSQSMPTTTTLGGQ